MCARARGVCERERGVCERERGVCEETRPCATVHVNYHPDKWERMLAIIDKFQKGKRDALDRFPDGSCKNAPNC